MKNRLKNFAVFSGIAIQMGAIIYGGSILGEWLDVRNNFTEPFYAKWVTLSAVFLSIVGVIFQVTKFSKN